MLYLNKNEHECDCANKLTSIRKFSQRLLFVETTFFSLQNFFSHKKKTHQNFHFVQVFLTTSKSQQHCPNKQNNTKDA